MTLDRQIIEQMEQVSGAFESAWREGRRPRPEDYADYWDEPYRAALLSELVALEEKLKQGAPPAGEAPPGPPAHAPGP